MSSGRLTVIFGGQFGSEGKGQVAAWMHTRSPFSIGVRVGGPNAGHTFNLPHGGRAISRTLPIPAWVGAQGVIGPGGMISPEVLARELDQAHQYLGGPARLIVDVNAALVLPEHQVREKRLKSEIGSTGEGVGAALAGKVMRMPEAVIGNGDRLMGYLRKEAGSLESGAACLDKVEIIKDSALVVNGHLESSSNASVLMEGTQGFGLSLHTGGYYPFCTSRECTPMGILAEAGVNPASAKKMEVLMVLRTFPIRVGGNSGELPGEITWSELGRITEGYVREAEMTTVTHKARRIAHLDWELIERAVGVCKPTGLVITFLDYQFPELAGVVFPAGLTKRHWEYLERFEKRLGVPVKLASTGPGMIIPLRVTI